MLRSTFQRSNPNVGLRINHTDCVELLAVIASSISKAQQLT